MVILPIKQIKTDPEIQLQGLFLLFRTGEIFVYRNPNGEFTNVQFSASTSSKRRSKQYIKTSDMIVNDKLWICASESVFKIAKDHVPQGQEDACHKGFRGTQILLTFFRSDQLRITYRHDFYITSHP